MGTYSMIGILIFVIISGENIVRGKQDWRKLLIIVCIIIPFVLTTINLDDLIPLSAIDLFSSQEILFLENPNPLIEKTYGIGYNIMFMSFSFALFYYMIVIKVHLSSEDMQISNLVIIGGILLGLMPHLSSIVFSGYPPYVVASFPFPLERLFYFPGFEFLLVATGSLIISYTFKKEPRLNQAYQILIKVE
jgi:hypothetical protein